MELAMAVVIAIIVITLPIGSYWLSRKDFLTQKEKVIVAEAGKISEMGKDYQPYVYMNPIQLCGVNNVKINSEDLLRVLVHGHCMEPIGIMDGSQVFAAKINKTKEFSLQAKHDDVLLIYLEDKNMFKLRIFEKYNQDKDLITYRYDQKTRQKRYSTNPHTIDSVIGVIKFKNIL